MTNQVQFIQLSQEEYDNISSKKNGSIYFTTDTHRIYKGGDLYASITFDTLEVGSIDAQNIKINNNNVLTEDKVVPDTNNAGFALNATKAKHDSNGEVISQTYARKDELTNYITPIVDAAIGNVLTQEEF